MQDTRTLAEGVYSSLNITAATNLGLTLNTSSGTVMRTVCRVVVVVTAATTSSICDTAGTSATAGNTILTIPASTTQGTIYTLLWPCQTGLAVVPGAGVTLAVSWS